MIVRELFIPALALAAFASAIATYLAVFHGTVTVKEVLSTALAAVIGLYAGRYLERRLIRG